MANDKCERAHATGVVPALGKVVLEEAGSTRQGNKPVSRVPLWPLFQFIPTGSYPDFPLFLLSFIYLFVSLFACLLDVQEMISLCSLEPVLEIIL